jgi:predicted nucleic acid-binding protein
VIVLDTTVLIYAVGTEHPLREPCQRLIRATASGTILATTTIEVIQEFTHVRARRRGRQDAAELARDYIELLSPLLIVEETDLREGLRLFQEGTGFGSFDAVLAAAAHAAGAEALVSADAGFSGIAAIHHVVPDAESVRRLLAGEEESALGDYSDET